MSTDFDELSAQLCKALCTRVSLRQGQNGTVRVLTPFSFPDGDGYSMYLKRLASGGLRISDMGSTLMHLSYEQDIDKLRDGTRGKVFQQILEEMGIEEAEGEFFLEIPADHLAQGVFRFGQALTRVHDLTFLNRIQVEKTFYDDLREQLIEIVGAERVVADFVAPSIPNAEEYAADFCIETDHKPLLVWGVPSQTKARLATIIIQHLRQHHFSFKSLIVYADMSAIPRADISRLTTAANDQIPSLSEIEAMRMKISDAIAV